jgi:hypothetical protein
LGDFVIQAVAWNKDKEVGRISFPITVGVKLEDRVKELEELIKTKDIQIADSIRILSQRESELHDLESELVSVRSSIDKLKFDIRKLVEG